MDVKHCKDDSKKVKRKNPGKQDSEYDKKNDPCVKHICFPDEDDPSKRECPEPFLCLERLKNPDTTQKNKPCDKTPFLGVKDCKQTAKKKKDSGAKEVKAFSAAEKVVKRHPCDKKLSCSSQAFQELKASMTCDGPALCYDRIKNPDDEKNMRKADDCIP